METYIYSSHDESQTQSLGSKLGELLAAGFTIGLNGTLGSGKTRLVKAIAAGLKIDPETVVSPTFTICVPYQGRLKVLHLDAYRIKQQEEVDELGLDEEIEDGAVLLVEWANKIKQTLPLLELEIEALPAGETTRRYSFFAHSDRARTLIQSLHDWSISKS